MSGRPRTLLVLLVSLVLLVGARGVARGAAPRGAAPVYVVADLGVLPGGSYSRANAINDRGQVVGAADTPLSAGRLGYEDAFRTSATGTLATPGADLGTLGGAASVALASSARSQVVGISDTCVGPDHGFRTAPGGAIAAATDLGGIDHLPSVVLLPNIQRRRAVCSGPVARHG